MLPSSYSRKIHTLTVCAFTVSFVSGEVSAQYSCLQNLRAQKPFSGLIQTLPFLITWGLQIPRSHGPWLPTSTSKYYLPEVMTWWSSTQGREQNLGGSSGRSKDFYPQVTYLFPYDKKREGWAVAGFRVISTAKTITILISEKEGSGSRHSAIVSLRYFWACGTLIYFHLDSFICPLSINPQTDPERVRSSLSSAIRE